MLPLRPFYGTHQSRRPRRDPRTHTHMHNMQILLARSVTQVLEPLTRRSSKRPQGAVALGAATVGEVLPGASGCVTAAGGPGG